MSGSLELAKGNHRHRRPRVTHSKPGALWHVDITVVPTLFGVAVAWCPFQLPAVFPFAHQVVGVEDHASRKVLALLAFRKQPTAAEVATTLDVAVERQGHAPRHIISDKGCQFWSGTAGKPTAVYSDWLEEHGVKPRFGAVGQHGSIAIIERFWRTLKECGLQAPVPLRFWRFNEELEIVRHWYNSRRPHSSLEARTPDEMAVQAAPPKSRAPRGAAALPSRG